MKNNKTLEKCPTGIAGLDEITLGGLPKGRPTLVCGNAGCGKTLMSMAFLVNGITHYEEPGVFMSFEERSEDLQLNFSSLGIDLNQLIKEKKLALNFVKIEKHEIIETGEYDLEGLFLRLEHAINSVGAKRVVLDTIEALFSGFSDAAVLRAELRRLFGWLKDKGVTAIITGERGDGRLTRHGLEEYVSDCVIFLDHRIINQISTRRLSIVKYRGSAHGTNEYPFLVDETGITVLPITSLAFDSHKGSMERISTGLKELDAMLGGQGYFQGSTILIAGGPGNGKTSFAAHFAANACRIGKRALFFSFEESAWQLTNNMRSIGIEFEEFLKKGSLWIKATRPTAYGLEAHLVKFHRWIEEFKPDVMIIDPISSFITTGTHSEVGLMFTRLIDYLKVRGVTLLFTVLGDGKPTSDGLGVSSLVDTLLLLTRTPNVQGYAHEVCVYKSRGMAHALENREFSFGPQGIKIAAGRLTAAKAPQNGGH